VKKPKVMLVVVKVVVMAVVLAVFSFKLQIVVVGVVVCFMHRLLWQCRLGIRENIIYRLTQLFFGKVAVSSLLFAVCSHMVSK